MEEEATTVHCFQLISPLMSLPNFCLFQRVILQRRQLIADTSHSKLVEILSLLQSQQASLKSEVTFIAFQVYIFVCFLKEMKESLASQKGKRRAQVPKDLSVCVLVCFMSYLTRV